MFTASLQIQQNGACDRFVVVDNSDYTSEPKNSFTNRRLIVYKSDGTVYRQPNQTTDEIPFSHGAYPTDQIEIVGLDKDYALTVIMTLTPAAPVSGSTYTVTSRFALSCFTMSAFYDRSKKQSINPRLELNNDYVSDTHRLLVEREAAVKAAAANDVASAQLSLNRAKKIIDNNKIPY